MIFELFDEKMRKFETISDIYVPDNIYIVARLDGRSFSKLTQKQGFKKPFDIKFKMMMEETVKHLMQCGFKILYGYSQSDEISLLFSLKDNIFNRKIRKINSVLAGEASSKFSLELGDLASFDCRVYQLPTKEDVIDYFSWRMADAKRNSLYAYCYWTQHLLEDKSKKQASKMLFKLSVEGQYELLNKTGILFNEIDAWKKQGFGVHWISVKRPGYNPLTKKVVEVYRNVLKVNDYLTLKDNYIRDNINIS